LKLTKQYYLVTIIRTCNLNKKFNYYKHWISYLTGTYNFEMEEFFHRFASRGFASISWAFLYAFYYVKPKLVFETFKTILGHVFTAEPLPCQLV